MLDEQRRKRINEKYLRLIDVSKHFIKKDDLKRINKAYEFAFKAELEEYKDGEELDIEHAIDVAIIAIEKIGLGTTSVISILLHNIADKSGFTTEVIEEKFGKSVASIISGFLKISGINTKKVSIQSDNFRRLYFSLVDDIRVVLIKLAHRLYDMKHLPSYPKEQQEIFKSEVTHIYVPIAHRLGLYRLKDEFEELLMAYEQTEIYKEIEQKLQATKSKRNVFIDDFSEPIRRELIRNGLICEIKGRPKSIHSVWNKMKKQNLKFEEVYDLFAIRIIIESKLKNEKSDCWKIYSIVTDIYPPNPKRLRDWITTPKASGYESLHTTVKAPNGKWVEVQIRSSRMDEIAEKGQAAHWRYKGFGSKKDSDAYLGQIRDIMENPDQVDFDSIDSSKMGKKDDRIYVFTPGGDLKKLKEGSSVLDFAYEIHTDVGDKCTGARVNGKNVPIRYQLNNGDKVEIVTSKNQKPKLDWLGYVVTSKAISKIKRSILEEKFQEAETGNEILRRKFRNWKIAFNEENIDRIIKHYKFKSSIDLYYSIAVEKLDLLEVKSLLTEEEEKKPAVPEKPIEKEKESIEKLADMEESLVIDDKLKDVNYKLAKCCNPVWGDAVFGFITIGKGITIHRLNCPNATDLLSKYDYRIIDVKWKTKDEKESYQSMISLEGEDRVGILGNVTNVISNDLKVNMVSLFVESEKDVFKAKMKVEVRDIDHLQDLIKKLARVPGIKSVRRGKR